MSKRALILGIGGMDGSYLTDILLERGYEVHGLYRRSSSGNLSRIAHIRDRVTLHMGDMADINSVWNAVDNSNPDEVYNEADQDSVGWSHVAPGYSYDITFAAVGRLLELLRHDKNVRMFQPLSAMMFGDPAHMMTSEATVLQDEQTPLHPMSPYACAKAAAWHVCRMYREQRGMFVSCGILFNHDSPRRTEDYLLHKICRSAVRIARGQQQTLALGNLDARVDIGYAREYMEAAVGMLQLDEPDDFVIATGVAERVADMVLRALYTAGIRGNYLGRITKDEQFWKPGQQGVLRGDSSKAHNAFGFAPKYDVFKLIDLLVQHFKEQP